MFNDVVSDVSYAGSVMRGEILGLERRRRWSDEDKLGIVMSVGIDNATVTQVAQRHENTRQQISMWRHELKGKGLWSPDAGALFLPIDFEALHNTVIHPGVKMFAQHSELDITPEHEAMAYLFNVPDASELGNIVMTGHHVDGNPMSTFEMKKAVVTYLTFYLAMGLDVAAQSGAFN